MNNQNVFSKVKDKTLVRNFLSLYFNNAVNYVIPLIVIPFLYRKIGVAGYGYFVFVFAIATYFKTFIEFGFDITLSKHIIMHKGTEIVSEYFTIVLISRILILLISALIFSVAIFLIPHDKILSVSFAWAVFGYVFSSVIGLNYFYYSFQQISYVTAANAVGKIFYLIATITMIKSVANMQTVAVLNSISWNLPAVLLFIFGISKYKLRLKWPSAHLFKSVFKEAAIAFASDFAVSLYGTANVFILGLLATPYYVGVYSGIEKVYNAITTIISSSNFALYPKLIQYYKSSAAILRKKVAFFEKVYMGIGFIIAITLLFLKTWLVKILFGNTNALGELYLQLFAISIIISPLGALYTRVLIIFDKTKTLLTITSIGFIVNVSSLILILVVFKRLDWLPVCVLITQLYISFVKRFNISKS